MNDEILAQVIKILATLPGQRKMEDQIGEHDLLRDELRLDSLQTIELVMALEDHFGFNISDEDLLKQDGWMATPASTAEFVRGYLGASEN